MQRRNFLGTVAAASAASTWTMATARAAGANERIRIGLIGCGGRGRYVAERMQRVPNVEFVAAADVYDLKFGRFQKAITDQATLHKDFREILDRSDVDGVLVATPDHWHAIPTVLACEAGKDVYVEKPLAHSIPEGRAMVRAARKNDRVVQTGTQQRSAPHFDTMRDLIKSGRIGNVRYVRIWNFKNTTPARKRAPSPKNPPAGLDWDFYLGPAPALAYDENRYGNFRRYWDYAGGIATNYGTHRFDSVRHALSIDLLDPRSVSASGQRFEVFDGSEDPDMVQMTFEYDDFVLSYEGCMMNKFGLGFRTPGRPYYNMLGHRDRPNGMAFYGTDGTIFADRLGFELYPELKPGRRTDRLSTDEITPEHFRTTEADGRSADSTYLHTLNFIECMRSRNRPVADVEIGHRSSILPHLGNIACRTGEKIQWDTQHEKVLGAPESAKLLGREARKPWDLI